MKPSHNLVAYTTTTSALSSALSSNPDAYFYTDTSGLVWDRQNKCWTKDSLTGDLGSSLLSDSNSLATLPTLSNVTLLSEQTISPAATPEHTTAHVSMSRPQSGMSFRSDDLQTIPSEEVSQSFLTQCRVTSKEVKVALSMQELLDEGTAERPSSRTSTPRGMELSPIRVDFGSSPPSSISVLSESEHQRHVLQQYSINQLRSGVGEKREHSTSGSHDSPPKLLSPRAQAIQDLRKSTLEAREVEVKQMSENNGFAVPTPQLQFAEMWESQKSVARVSASSHLKPHNCKVIELDRQNLRVEPHMTPPPLVFTPVHSRTPSLPDPDLLVEHPESLPSSHGPRQEQAILYNAWSAPRPNAPTKHSLLTSTRLMHK